MAKAAPTDFESFWINVEDAAIKRELRVTDQEREPDETTLDDVTDAIYDRRGPLNYGDLAHRDMCLRALRRILNPIQR